MTKGQIEGLGWKWDAKVTRAAGEETLECGGEIVGTETISDGGIGQGSN